MEPATQIAHSPPPQAAGQPERFSCIPDCVYYLIDLSGYRDEELQGAVMLQTALLTLKYIFRDDLRERLPEILGLLRDLEQSSSGLDYVITLLRYLAQQGLDTFEASVLREGAVRVDGLPLVFTAVGAQDLPRNTRVQVQITGTDLITLEVFGRVIGQITTLQQAAEPGAEAEEDEDAVALAAPISVAVDTDATPTEPAADAPGQAS